ncbi:MAG: hypothetical protein ACJ8E2_00975 [Bradyrhizobium sp.]|jgi:hypothetical protein
MLAGGLFCAPDFSSGSELGPNTLCSASNRVHGRGDGGDKAFSFPGAFLEERICCIEAALLANKVIPEL